MNISGSKRVRRPRCTRTPWWSLPVVWWGAVRIILASASSSTRAICPNVESRRDWIIAVRLGGSVILRTSSLRTDWCHFVASAWCHEVHGSSQFAAKQWGCTRHTVGYRGPGGANYSAGADRTCPISTIRPRRAAAAAASHKTRSRLHGPHAWDETTEN